MTCPACGDKPQKAACGFPKAVIEIDNPEQINLFRKVVVPTSMGDDKEVPPAIGKYRNVLLNYEANNHTYLYSSDGIPTLLTSEVAEAIEQRVDKLEITLADEIDAREKADDDLQTLIDTKADASSLSTVATSGDYNDLTNKPTIGDATLTIQRNSTDVGTFTANSTTNATIDISVPTTPADIGAQAEITSDNKLSADLVDDTDATNKFVTAADLSAISTALQPADIDKVVMTDIDVSGNTSTTTVALEAAKENLMSGAQTTKSIALPVASTTEAGVMNSSTFDAVTNNTNNINALLNGAVAVTGLPASPSQSDITTAWQTETGLTTLINRASVYDVTNDKVWTYYTNDTTWHAASNTAQVTINTFTNNSEGTIKGSTNVGQVFAENDGTGSVNGWDALNAQVSDNTNNIGTLQTAMAGKQDKLTAGSNITISSNTISATDTTYTAGTGLTLAGTQFSADTSVLQEKLTAGNAIDITSNVISADIYPADYFTADATTTDTDSNITLNNTLNAKLDSVELYGDTEQQTYTGKNLFDSASASNNKLLTWTTGVLNDNEGSIVSDYIAVSENTQIQLTYLAAVFFYDSSKNLIGHFGTNQQVITTSGGGYYNSFTVPSGYSITYIRLNLRASQGTNPSDLVGLDIMVNTGDELLPFEPYVGGVPAPSPSYPQNINVATGEQNIEIIGKNIWNPTPYQTSHFIAANGVESSNPSVDTWGNVYAPANTTFTMQAIFGTSGRCRIHAFSLDGIWLEQIAEPSCTANTKMVETFTTPNQPCLIRWCCYKNPTNPQLEYGLNASSFEEYQSQSYTVDLGSIKLCNINSYQDYIYKSGNDWHIHKVIGQISFDGTETWTQVNSYAYFSTTISDDIIRPSDIYTKPLILSDNYLSASRSNLYDSAIDYGIGIHENTPSRILIRNKDCASIPAFTTWLSGHNTLVYYVLQTPTDTQITDNTLIGQLEALANANSYLGITNFVVTATGTNLPVLLSPIAYRNSAAGVAGTIGAMPDQQVQSDWAQVDTTAVDYIKNKPTLATVATTGDYDDLVDKPALATVATSGSYSDLSNKPTIPAAQVNSDWNANSGVAQILNKPSLATVATSGSYTDLSNKPSIPAAQIQSDWTQTNTVAKDYIKNKPAVPTITMTNVDPGEGSALAADNYIGVYGSDPIILDYATSEINTGAKWIDGSDIYKKTISIGTLPNDTSKDVAHNISNLGSVIKIEGWAYDSNNSYTYPIPYTSVTPSNCITCYVRGADIRIVTGIDRSDVRSSYVTLYYTKSS